MKTPEKIVSVFIYGHERELPKSIFLSELITPDRCIDAMKEHAKEVAIDFHKWVTKNYWHMGDNEWMETGSDKRYTSEELYELFLKTLK